MAIDNLELTRRFNERFNQHDADGCAAMAADDGRFTDLTLGFDGEGPEGLREWIEIWLSAFPDASIEHLSTVVAGDTVVVEGMFHGTQSGPLVTPMGSIPASGRRLDGHYCSVLRVRDGKFVGAHQYYDGLALLRQLGVAPGVAPQEEANPQP
jgi:predicted ester cyclase